MVSLGGIGDAGINIVIQAQDKFSKEFDKARKGAAKLGAALTAIGIAGVIGLSKLANEASDLQESVNAVNVVFENSSDAILAIGKDAARSFGMSKKAFNSGAVRFSAFAKIVAGEGGDVANVIKDITGRTADFASVMNIEMGTAQVLMQAGLAGETEGLRRYGIDVSAASIKTFAYANGIGTVGTELTEQQKILARYKSIMAQTEKTAGDFANTSDGLANRQRILSATIIDLKADLGQSLLPAFEDIIGVVQKVVDWFSNLTDGQKKFLVILTSIITGLTLIVGPILILLAMLPLISAGFALLSAVTLPITLTILAIVAGIAFLVAAFVILWKKWEELGTKAKIILAVFAPWLVLPIAIIKNWEPLKLFFANMWNSIVEYFEMGANKVIDAINYIIRARNKLKIFGQKEEIGKMSFGGAMIDVSQMGKKAEEKLQVEEKITAELTKQEQLIKSGYKLIPETGDIFNPNSSQKSSDFENDFAYNQAVKTQTGRSTMAGQVVEINIDNVNGLDPEEVSIALEKIMRDKGV